MKRTIVFLLTCVIYGCISAQSVEKFTMYVQGSKYDGTIYVNNGSIRYVYSTNGGAQREQTFHCDPDVGASAVSTVIMGIYNGQNVFYYLKKISFNIDISQAKTYIRKAINECNEANIHYFQGYCHDRAEDFANMSDDLTFALGAYTMDDMMQYVVRLKQKYSHLYTFDTCGWIY